MQGLTRGAMTLLGVVGAGFLIWWGASALPGEGDATIGEFWWAAALIAAAGLIMALSQLLGGWTKWGRPRISGNVFLLGFLPALIAGGWVVLAFGLTFDTTGPRAEPALEPGRPPIEEDAEQSGLAAREREADDRRVPTDEGETPQPGAPPR